MFSLQLVIKMYNFEFSLLQKVNCSNIWKMIVRWSGTPLWSGASRICSFWLQVDLLCLQLVDLTAVNHFLVQLDDGGKIFSVAAQKTSSMRHSVERQQLTRLVFFFLFLFFRAFYCLYSPKNCCFFFVYTW